jgi:hypothetical protein
VRARTIRSALLLAAALLLTAAVCLPIGRAADATALPEDGPQLTEPQQQAALEFVKEHHPQLNTLIHRLKTREPGEYHKALDEVHSTRERLQRLQTRDPQRYEVDLKLWKVESRIRLLAARMAADQNIALESQLRELLTERSDLRLQQLTLERVRLTERVERLDNQISQFASERDAAIDRQIDRLRKSVRARSGRISPDADAATPPDSEARKSAGPQQQDETSRDDKRPTPATDNPQT